MGRKKIELELISNEKRRYMTYQKRQKGLEKKAYELSTLCDVRVCLITYGPKDKGDNQSQELNIWPENPDFIRCMIESYGEQSETHKKVRTQDLSRFYSNLAKKEECERGKVDKRKHECNNNNNNNNNNKKYPIWDERFNSLSACELGKVMSDLDIKVDAIKERIHFLKGKRVFSHAPKIMRFLGAQGIEDSNPPAPAPAQPYIQQTTSYNVNPMMNHPGMMMMNFVNPITENHVIMGPMPISAAVIRPSPATVPYGWNFPTAMIPYDQYPWLIPRRPY